MPLTEYFYLLWSADYGRMEHNKYSVRFQTDDERILLFLEKMDAMKAAVLEEYRKMVWKEVPTPEITGDEVLMKVKYA
ncbi:MAG: hypothetical protein H6Q21_949, partial [Bacteroidetes bacterium]|nr:hypothetical protein [Bacteroidota bacterium]